MNRNFLISGATGFLGATLTRLLIGNGEKCTIIVRDELSFNSQTLRNLGADLIDVKNCKLILFEASEKFSHVIHLANSYIKSPTGLDLQKMITVNIDLGLLLIKVANMHQSYFLYGASYLEYESHNDLANALYVDSKRTFSDIFDLNALLNKKQCKLTLFDSYGIGDNRKKIVSELVKQYMNNDYYLDIKNPHKQIILTHVSDIANAIIKLAYSETVGEYRASTDFAIEIAELQKYIMKIIENHTTSYLPPIPKSKYKALAISKPLDWKPQVELKDGLLELIRMESSNLP